jgi:hypothetical protein
MVDRLTHGRNLRSRQMRLRKGGYLTLPEAAAALAALSAGRSILVLLRRAGPSLDAPCEIVPPCEAHSPSRLRDWLNQKFLPAAQKCGAGTAVLCLPAGDRRLAEFTETAENVAGGLYARVSSNHQQTLAMQNRAMREYAARRGWMIALQVREVNSGAAKREAREKLLEAARRREIEVVLVWRWTAGAGQ